MDSVDLPEYEYPSREETYKAFLRCLMRRKGFGIVFVQCSPVDSENLLYRLQQDLYQKQIKKINFDKPIDNLYDFVVKLAGKQDSSILFIQGLEKSLEPFIKSGYGGDGDYYNIDTIPPILNHLNQRREKFRDHFNDVCFVFFLPLFGVTYIIRRAPDFFDWSAGVFEFSQNIDFQEEALIYKNIGDEDFSLGRYREAIASFDKALEIYREIGLRKDEADTLKQLAELYQSLGEIEVARRYCQQALVLAIELGIPLAAECEALQLQLDSDRSGE